jgi:bifunctional non-homologous end joining protein LigD
LQATARLETQMSDKLDSYKAKRDFSATPEPEAEPRPAPGAGEAPRFVVQEHHARRLHWDLRLERDGVLASWALPKGVPPDPKVNHLAVPTEDHPLSYLDFTGDIPTGSYGAGTMSIWDRGTYDLHKWDGREVIVTLHGERVNGRYALFRTGEDRWMIHRMDPPQDPEREPMPEQVAPMLATSSEVLPSDDGRWGYEIKWDGVRMIAFVAGGTVKLQGRRMLDATARYAELRGLADVVSSHEVVLDGEVVALDEEGRPDFGLLQRRMNVAEGSALRRVAREVPVVYMLFDVLYLDGHQTLARPYTERRRLLEGLSLNGPSWQTPSYHVGDGAALLDATRARGLEGLVAKRLDSVYRPGRRTASWVKVKNVRRQELVVGGWLSGQGNRAGRLGALLVGYYQGDDLRYAGRVGSGFTDQELERLHTQLAPLARDTSPFTPPPPLPPEVARQGHFVEPTLVAEVAFSEWTHLGTLRAPRYKGMRTDVDPRVVVREAATSDDGAEGEA